jgi:hypothetical protein
MAPWPAATVRIAKTAEGTHDSSRNPGTADRQRARTRSQKEKEKVKKSMHQPGIEPGSVPWQGTILPLDHWCLMSYRNK